MPHDHHEHLSPSGHPFRADNDGPLTYWQAMEIAVRELLIEKGVTTAATLPTAQRLWRAFGPTPNFVPRCRPMQAKPPARWAMISAR